MFMACGGRPIHGLIASIKLKADMDRREKKLTRCMGVMLLMLATLAALLDSPLPALMAAVVGIMCLFWSALENWLDRE